MLIFNFYQSALGVTDHESHTQKNISQSQWEPEVKTDKRFNFAADWLEPDQSEGPVD